MGLMSSYRRTPRIHHNLIKLKLCIFALLTTLSGRTENREANLILFHIHTNNNSHAHLSHDWYEYFFNKIFRACVQVFFAFKCS